MSRLQSTGLGGIVLLFLAPAFLDALDSSLGLVVASPAFRLTIRLAAFSAVAALLYSLLRKPTTARILFEEEELCVEGIGATVRTIPYRSITAAHAYGTGGNRRVIVGVQGNLPLSLPQAAFTSAESVEEFLRALRTQVAATQGLEALQDYDARSRLGEETSHGWIPVTFGLIVLSTIALVIAIATRVQSDPLGMLRFGALSSAMVRAGEYERLISYVFVHWNLTHLWANLAPLIALGWTLERLLGWRLYSLILLSATFATSVLALTSGGGVLRVGASGLVCACFGVLLYLNLRRTRELPPLSQVPMALWLMLLVLQALLLLGWIRAGAPSTGIDHLGHAWGWIAGATVAAIATDRRSLAELRTLRTSALRAGPWIAAGVACAALTTSALRAVGFSLDDRVRAASALLLAPETPAPLRGALARATVLSSASSREQVLKAQHATRMLLRVHAYDGRTLDTLARAQARLGHLRRAISTARAALLWHPDKSRAAAHLARLLWSMHEERGSISMSGSSPMLSLTRQGDAVLANVSEMERAKGRRGMVAYVVAHDSGQLHGLLIVRLGGYLSDSYALSGLPDWVRDPFWELTTVARTAHEVVDLPSGEAAAEAYTFPTEGS